MKKLPVTPVKLPSDLKTQANGNLDPEILKPITGSKMHRLAAKAFKAMEKAAKKDGIILKPTSASDAYRPLSVQEKAFLSRYDNKPRKSSLPRSYDGKRWWLIPGNAPAAVPGTSNHGWGLAIDIANIDQKKVEWLLKNAATFGFSWELQNEPWHIRYVAGDNLPTAVQSSESKSVEDVATEPAKKVAKKAVKKATKKATATKTTAKKAPAKKTVKKAAKKRNA